MVILLFCFILIGTLSGEGQNTILYVYIDLVFVYSGDFGLDYDFIVLIVDVDNRSPITKP